MLEPTGADTTDTTCPGSPVPGVVRPVGGTYIEVIAGADDPHRHIRAETAAGALGSQFQLLGTADVVKLGPAPTGHQIDPTRTSDLMARRSSIAA